MTFGPIALLRVHSHTNSTLPMSKKKDEKAPEENVFKVKGNAAFQDKDYPKAVEFYSLAIDGDQGNNHILFSNRSAAYAALRKFDAALQDADKCIEIQATWAKGYFRRGLALEGLGRYAEAYAAYQKGLTVEPTDALLQKASSELSIMMEELKQSSAEMGALHNPEHDRFQVMLDWLKAGGAKFPKLYLQYYDTEYRGVHCAARIPVDEIVLQVPLPLIMTSEVAKASTIGKLVVEAETAGLELRSKHTYLACFLVQERRKGAESYWYPYISTLPQQFKNVPIFFDDDEMKWLRGSMNIEKIAERKETLRIEYNNLRRFIPSFSEFTYDEFVWGRMVVITRIFGLYIDAHKTDGLVPMADMLNHKRPRQTKWNFEDSTNCFTITSLQALSRGDQVFDSYGQKCNSRFFVNYGFALEHNEADNEVLYVFDIPPNDPHFQVKQRLLGGECRKIIREHQIPTSFREQKTQEALSFLRFVCARDAELMALTSSGPMFRLEEIDPISIRNEKDVLLMLKDTSLKLLSGFETSLSEDDELLKNPNLTFNQRNCVIVRRGEKQVLQYYIDLADHCMPYFDMPWSTLKKMAQKMENAKVEGRFDCYMLNVVAPLVKLK